MASLPNAEIISLFVRESNQRFADMNKALAALDTDASDARALETLMRRFHSFAGVAGLDGHEIINTLGSRGEGECRRLLDASAKATADHLRRWRSIIEVMQTEVEEVERLSAKTAQSVTRISAPRRIYDVLLVDDDPEVHAFLTPRLQEEGFNVNSALTRADAMECLLMQRPHALVVDLALEDGSGYDVIDRLRTVEGHEGVAVLIISKRGAFLDRVAGIRSGADDYFSKPFDADKLVRKLRSLVQSRDESMAKILSVEDDPDQAEYLRAILESAGYIVRSCDDPRNFETELANFAPDLILMDILLPEVSGYELARFARQDDDHQTTPILFLTTEGHSHTRIQSLKSGGDDHIVKPVSPSLLLATVETRIERARQIRQFLDRDNLTGLFNRGAFLRKLQARIRRVENGPAALVMLDVDRFKQLNDGHGHGFGDQVLSRLAAYLRTHVRASDDVCRYGGEEFTMLIDDVTEHEAACLVDRLREEFASIPHISPEGRSIYVSFSAGVAALPGQVSAMARTLEIADAALYRAKAEGRNRVCEASQKFPARIPA